MPDSSVLPTYDFGAEVRLRAHDGGWPVYVEAHSARLRSDEQYARAWFQERKSQFDAALTDIGALILRGFPITDAASFSRFIQHYPPMPQGYAGGTAKREQLAERVYDTTTTRAANFKTRLHQEMAYFPIHPKQVAFFCHIPPATDGETPIADIRRLEKLIPPVLFKGVQERGLRYVRGTRAPGQKVDAPEENQFHLNAFYRPWPEAYGTTDKTEVERFLRSMDLAFEWLPSGGLTTHYNASGFTTHPRSGAKVWFNSLTLQHANHVAAGMSRAVYARAFPPDAPKAYDVLYGDGTPIAEELILEMYDIQDSITVAPKWQTGDLMLLDNIYTAHGGNPYTGPRDIQVSMFY